MYVITRSSKIINRTIRNNTGFKNSSSFWCLFYKSANDTATVAIAADRFLSLRTIQGAETGIHGRPQEFCGWGKSLKLLSRELTSVPKTKTKLQKFQCFSIF